MPDVGHLVHRSDRQFWAVCTEKPLMRRRRYSDIFSPSVRTVTVTTSMEGIASWGDVAVLVLVRDAVRPRRLLAAEASE